MTTAFSMTSKKTVYQALLDLFGFGGYGVSRLEVNADGELVHLENVVTIKPRLGEDGPAFVARIYRDYLQAGDKIELSIEGSKVNLARITRIPRG